MCDKCTYSGSYSVFEKEIKSYEGDGISKESGGYAIGPCKCPVCGRIRTRVRDVAISEGWIAVLYN